MATQANRAQIINSTIPTCSSIAEFDLAMLEEFVDNTKLLVNSLGYKVFDSVEDNVKSKSGSDKYFYIKAARGADGIGLVVSDGFAVLKGSKIANPISTSMAESLIKLRKKLISSMVIDENYRFIKDYVFTSPSLAAAIVMGRNANGRTEWKTKDHRTLKQMEESK